MRKSIDFTIPCRLSCARRRLHRFDICPCSVGSYASYFFGSRPASCFGGEAGLCFLKLLFEVVYHLLQGIDIIRQIPHDVCNMSTNVSRQTRDCKLVHLRKQSVLHKWTLIAYFNSPARAGRAGTLSACSCGRSAFAAQTRCEVRTRVSRYDAIRACREYFFS